MTCRRPVLHKLRLDVAAVLRRRCGMVDRLPSTTHHLCPLGHVGAHPDEVLVDGSGVTLSLAIEAAAEAYRSAPSSID